MKKTVWLLLLTMIMQTVGFESTGKLPTGAAVQAASTTYSHTINIDGNQDFYDSVNGQKYQNETFSTSLSSAFSYVTWDANFVYFAYQADDVRSYTSNASNKWIWLYIGGPGGTTTGLNYAGQEPKLPFAAKYHVRFRVDGSYTNRQMWNGSSWIDQGSYSWGSNVARNDSKGYVEFKFPRVHFGLEVSSRLQMVSALVYEDKAGNGDSMWAAMPWNAFGAAGNGYDRDFQTFYQFDLNAVNAAAAQAYHYNLTVAEQTAERVRLTFNALPGATAVAVQQSADGGVTWTTAVTSAPLSALSTGATISGGLAEGGTYLFRLMVTGGALAGQSVPVEVKLRSPEKRYLYTHSIKLDGVNDFYTNSKPASNETFATSSGSAFSFITWDNDYLYLGYHAEEITSTTGNAANKWIWVYAAPGGFGSGAGNPVGTTKGLNYAGQQPLLPFAAQYHLRFRVDGSYTNRQMWNGTTWVDQGSYSWGTNVARNDGLRFMEFKIPRAHLGLTSAAASLKLVSAIIVEDKLGTNDTMFAAVPAHAFGAAGNGYDRDFLDYYEFDLRSPVAAAAQVYSYELKVTGKTASSVRLQFAPQADAERVWLEQSVNGGASWTRAKVAEPITSVSTNATVTGLNAATAYQFRLMTVGRFANGNLVTDLSALGGADVPVYTPAPMYPVTERGKWLLDVYTERARYAAKQTVQVSVDVQNPLTTAVTGKLTLVLAYLDTQVSVSTPVDVTLNAAASAIAPAKRTVVVPLTMPSFDFRGYRIDAYWQLTGTGGNANGNLVVNEYHDVRSGAVDVSSDWSRFPRYGYITDYPDMTEQQVANVIRRLNRYHINALQYYDWQWKHHIPVKMENGAPAAVWKDIANRDVYSATIRKYIAQAKQRNMLNMNYNLMFGAYVGADKDGVLPQWGLFKDRFRQTQDAHPLPDSWATNRILIQNPFNDGWVNYILRTEKEALDQFGFDGWHIDQLGSRGTLYDYNGNVVKFDDAFGSMLGKIKSGLKTRLVMNAVAEYGVEQIAAAPVDVLYTEVWPDTGYGSVAGDKSYNQLKRHVETGLRLGNGERGQVLAAYMNYQGAERPGFFNTPAVLLTNAVIMGAGGTHLELGDTGMLGKEYFPNKNLQMTADLEERLKRYYDFQTAYQNVLMDGVQPLDLPVQSLSAGTKVVTGDPQAGAVWAFARQADGAQVVHLVNLSNNQTTEWRDDFGTNVTMPAKKTNVRVQVKTATVPEKVYAATADGELRMVELPMAVAMSSDGQFLVEVTVPELTLWSMLVLKEPGVKVGSSVWVSEVTSSAVVNPVADVVSPSVPGGLVSSNVTAGGFRVSWNASTDNVGLLGYHVYRGGVYVATVRAPVSGGAVPTSYVFSGLAANTVYSVRVQAVDTSKNVSALSGSVAVRTLSGTSGAGEIDRMAPSVPSGLLSSGVTASGFRVSWNGSSDNVGLLGYHVYRGGVYVATVRAPVGGAGGAVPTSYVFTGLAANTVYSVRVQAVDTSKNVSALSGALGVRTLGR